MNHETKPFEGQKPGTSGLRKKTKVFQSPHYVENFVQSTFDSLDLKASSPITLLVGGDGRFFNRSMCQTIVKMASANGFSRVMVPVNCLISTPAVSCVIRKHNCFGAFILTASHNPGGPLQDVGIKYNTGNGGPAQEALTDAIYARTQTISQFKMDSFPDVDFDTLGVVEPRVGFSVDVFDGTMDYVQMMQELFDFKLLRTLFSRRDFNFCFDGMSGVAGPYARCIFHDLLGVDQNVLMNCDPSEDFNGCHPDPNLTYAPSLVAKMGLTSEGVPLKDTPEAIPDFGAAADGDADRNMVLGRQFFVTPSDSLAVLAAHVQDCVPYFQKHGLKAIARSMPTSAAADLVAKKLKVNMFEVPTGWKFFVNLCEQNSPLLCGEESFGTGSSHIREKDGIFAVLCWLSVLAKKNEDATLPFKSVQSIVQQHWQEFGRNHYQRYDYEDVDAKLAESFTKNLSVLDGQEIGFGFKLAVRDEFSYLDPVDHSVSKNQGWRFLLTDGSRFVIRLSGTGSSGATIRVYLEKYTHPAEGADKLNEPSCVALQSLVQAALSYTKLQEYLQRDAPSVIT